MQYFSLYFILAGLFITSSVYPQTGTNSEAFRADFVSPLDIPLYLSSNYGEYRSGHFHAGVDFKTQQVENKNVFAVDTGYVYRIAVLAGSYGKAVYIMHPSGYVSLYGHLNKFEASVEKYVKEQQYRKKSFTVDLYPEPWKFAVRKGGFIGLSGNTGMSFGAHLHFEIRDKSGAVPLNPLQYGFKVNDRTKPEIRWLMIYALDTGSYINGINKSLPIKVQSTNSGYIVIPDTIEVTGNVGVGIESYDYLDNTSNPCGPASIEMTVDHLRYFLCRIDSIPFSSSAYINSYFDYGEMLRSGRKIQKLFLDPNNNLNIYKVTLNRGMIQFDDEAVHPVLISVKDTYGNQSDLKFNLKSVKKTGNYSTVADSFVVSKFYYDSLNVFENQHARIVVPRKALFDNIDFSYAEIKNDTFRYSLVHQVHNRYTPLLAPYILSIRADNLPAKLQARAIIVSRGLNKRWVSQGGEFKNGFVSTRTKAFGQFTVMVDTVSPEIKPAGFTPGSRYTAGAVISFTIADTLSGIRKYSGYIDKTWALFEYDLKNDMLSYVIDPKKLTSGILHELEIIVTDNKDNVARYKKSFYF